MQPEPSESFPIAHTESSPEHDNSPRQHGLHRRVPSTPPLPLHGTRGGSEGSSTPSEWSLSPDTSGVASPASNEARLSPKDGFRLDDEALDFDTRAALLDQSEETREITEIDRLLLDASAKPALHTFPEEMLFQIISHLSAADLITMKLVSRRFYLMVSSPTAWRNAFDNFFPGPDALRNTLEPVRADQHDLGLKSEKRYFTRLTPTTSWSKEYLMRTRLLRCLIRGRPSLPFAAPSPGKPGRGSATFTFSLRMGDCSNLHADFGQMLDKRKPQFIHGLASKGSVSCSDRKGKFDSWGFRDRVAFRHFSETHPGHARWGLGNGELVGVPNMMDLSQQYGMIYGEGTPGGMVFHVGTEEKHGQYLAPFLNISKPDHGIPRIDQERQSTTSVWIAKSTAVPRVTGGVVGMLAGLSSGVVSAYSLGPLSNHDQRLSRGQLTARWLLSPGVPIIKVFADDYFSEERENAHRVWAVALNALGEVFYLTEVPVLASDQAAVSDERKVQAEFAAWQTGKTATWRIVKDSLRHDRYRDETPSVIPTFLPSHFFTNGQTPVGEETAIMETWLAKSAAEMRARFDGWNMRRRFEVDLANDDGRDAGETTIVIDCGIGEAQDASITRYVRRKLTSDVPVKGNTADDQTRNEPHEHEPSSGTSTPSWSFANIPKSEVPLVRVVKSDPGGKKAPSPDRSDDHWQSSRFTFGPYKLVKITTSAIDESHWATTTLAEDQKPSVTRASRRPGANQTSESKPANAGSSQIPGQRARLFGVGTSTGSVFLWNARAPLATAEAIVNNIPPLRVVHTESPGITALALTALCVVHGGAEGQIQAWDPLASTLGELRTLSSRRNIANRRRAVVAAQQNPGLPQPQTQYALAATSICLDPDPTVLRGAAAIGGFLKYWSYSNAPADDDISRSQKRRMQRAKRGVGKDVKGTGYDFKAGRRSGLTGFLNQEVEHHQLDERDRRNGMKQERRIANRFGLELLGADASEEDMLAYAKLLSEEETERKALEAARAEAKLTADASQADVEAHKSALSEADAEKWKYASWQARFEMLPEGGVPVPLGHGQSLEQPMLDVDEDMKRAMELSLAEENERNASSSAASPSGASHATTNLDALTDIEADPDLAEAIALSLTHEQMSSSPELPTSSGLGSRQKASAKEDEDLARAMRMSLAESRGSTPRRTSSIDVDEFPSLSSSSPTSGSNTPAAAAAAKGKGKGKGKRSAWPY